MTLPNFIIIGAGRSGTTSLYHYLRQHPDVFMSPVKETQFFAWQAEWAGKTKTESNNRICAVSYPVRDLQDYTALFAGANGQRAIGEATPRYMYATGVPEALASILPQVKLIAILRDPAERVFSMWMGNTADRREHRSFEQVIKDEAPHIDHVVSPGEFAYLRPSLYHLYVMKYLDYFNLNQILILFYEDFIFATEVTLRRVFRFLGIDETAAIDTSIRYNPTGFPRHAAVERITAKTPLTVALKRHTPVAIRDPLYRLAMQWRYANRRRPVMAPDNRRVLVSLFRGDTEALAKLLDRDLSAWLASDTPIFIRCNL